ncbi:centrosome-associated protein CEP250-like isoform X2 [Fagus crenata]
MFSLCYKHIKTEKSWERLEFKFSDIQALQVPKGWDKLFFVYYFCGNRKNHNQVREASVQNGICQWEEALSESIWISPDDASICMKNASLNLLLPW